MLTATRPLTDAQRACMQPFLNTYSVIYVGNAARIRLFREAVVWIARAGDPGRWRQLPAEYGMWKSVYRR